VRHPSHCAHQAIHQHHAHDADCESLDHRHISLENRITIERRQAGHIRHAAIIITIAKVLMQVTNFLSQTGYA
jgi:hypothetical protein